MIIARIYTILFTANACSVDDVKQIPFYLNILHPTTETHLTHHINNNPEVRGTAYHTAELG